MRPYQYRCHDYSFLTPHFKRWIISPLIRFVPWAVPANIITFVSNGFVYLALYLALTPGLFGAGTPILISACLILYLIGDHLDGMQAKRTGTGSALGEFCDHYLDAFNNGVIIFTMITLFGIQNKDVVIGVIVVSYWAHMAVFYEQLKTGWLTFEAIGSLEGVMLSALIIALSAIPQVHSLYTAPLLEGYSFIEILMMISSIGAVVTFYKTWQRTPGVRPSFWLFSFFLGIIGVAGIPFFSSFQLFVLVTLYAGLYIGKIMHGHLIDGVERTPDFVAPLLILLLYIPGFGFEEYFFGLLTIYLSLQIAVLVFKTFSVLKVYWVWLNLRT